MKKFNEYIVRYRESDKYITPYLDRLMPDGKRFRKSLSHLRWLNKKTYTSPEKFDIKNRKAQADEIRSTLNKELYNESVGKITYALDESFIGYLEQKLSLFDYDKRPNTKLEAVIKLIQKFEGKDDVLFEEVIEVAWLTRFKSFLENTYRTKSGKGLAVNTQSAYLRKVKLYLYKAYKERKVPYYNGEEVLPIEEEETDKESLDIEELQLLVTDEEVNNNLIYKAFVFCCYTGLRYGDAKSLKFEEIKLDSSNVETQYYMRKKMGKTKKYLEVFFNSTTLNLIGYKKGRKGYVFEGIKDYERPKISNWVKSKGIDKHITFHSSRHTNADLLINNGVDIYTVKELLGHKSIKTTSIYLSKKKNNLISASSVITNLLERLPEKE